MWSPLSKESERDLMMYNCLFSFYKQEKLERSERKYGEFALSFKIPEIYERKWSTFTVENGVLTIIYEKDKDD